jgi:hypothetical protein
MLALNQLSVSNALAANLSTVCDLTPERLSPSGFLNIDLKHGPVRRRHLTSHRAA